MKNLTGIILEPKRFAVHDGPGIRTTFFLKGCPLRCLWCHNPESISPQPELAYYAHKCIRCGECAAICRSGAHGMAGEEHRFDRNRCTVCGSCETVCLGRALRIYGKRVSPEEVVALALQDRIFYEQSGGGVTLSGGEPLFQAEFCLELLNQLKAAGLHTALDTCCFVPRPALEAALPVTDRFLVDFKHSDSVRHRELTGQGNELILENLRFLSERGAEIEIRIPFVPGCNDSEENMERTGEILGSLNIDSVKLLPYHALARSKYAALGKKDTMPSAPSPSPQQIDHAVQILRKHHVNASSGTE